VINDGSYTVLIATTVVRPRFISIHLVP
jgi:hypothetical protein